MVTREQSRREERKGRTEGQEHRESGNAEAVGSLRNTVG